MEDWKISGTLEELANIQSKHQMDLLSEKVANCMDSLDENEEKVKVVGVEEDQGIDTQPIK